MSAPAATMTRCTMWPLMSRPRIAFAASSASAGVLATLTPPALPRPPVFTCALTTVTPPSFSAAARASSGVSATIPASTGTPYFSKTSRAWYSKRSTLLLLPCALEWRGMVCLDVEIVRRQDTSTKRTLPARRGRLWSKMGSCSRATTASTRPKARSSRAAVPRSCCSSATRSSPRASPRTATSRRSRCAGCGTPWPTSTRSGSETRATRPEPRARVNRAHAPVLGRLRPGPPTLGRRDPVRGRDADAHPAVRTDAAAARRRGLRAQRAARHCAPAAAGALARRPCRLRPVLEGRGGGPRGHGRGPRRRRTGCCIHRWRRSGCDSRCRSAAS